MQTLTPSQTELFAMRDAARLLAANLQTDIRNAQSRSEHIRLTRHALEAAKLAVDIDLYVSRNTEPGTGPIPTVD